MSKRNIRSVARTDDTMRLELALDLDILLFLDGTRLAGAVFNFDRITSEALVGYNRLEQQPIDGSASADLGISFESRLGVAPDGACSSH